MVPKHSATGRGALAFTPSPHGRAVLTLPQLRMAGPRPEPAKNIAPLYLGGTGLRPASLVTLDHCILEAVKTGVPLGSVPVTESKPVNIW